MIKIKNEKQLRKLYWDDGLPYRKVAKTLGVQAATILRNMKKYKIPFRTQKEAIKMARSKGKSWGAEKGERHFNWQGGKTFNPYGYKLVNIALLSNKEKKLFQSMFFGHNNNVIFEHRLVMARKLGRPLKKGEEIHHLNGIKDDNRIKNLLLLTGKKHRDYIPALQKKIRDLEYDPRRTKIGGK